MFQHNYFSWFAKTDWQIDTNLLNINITETRTEGINT